MPGINGRIELTMSFISTICSQRLSSGMKSVEPENATRDAPSVPVFVVLQSDWFMLMFVTIRIVSALFFKALQEIHHSASFLRTLRGTSMNLVFYLFLIEALRALVVGL